MGDLNCQTWISYSDNCGILDNTSALHLFQKTCF